MGLHIAPCHFPIKITVFCARITADLFAMLIRFTPLGFPDFFFSLSFSGIKQYLINVRKCPRLHKCGFALLMVALL